MDDDVVESSEIGVRKPEANAFEIDLRGERVHVLRHDAYRVRLAELVSLDDMGINVKAAAVICVCPNKVGLGGQHVAFFRARKRFAFGARRVDGAGEGAKRCARSASWNDDVDRREGGRTQTSTLCRGG